MRNSVGSVGKVYFLLLLLVVPALAQSWDKSGAPPTATGPVADDDKPRTAQVDGWAHSGAAPAATGPRADDPKPRSARVDRWMRSGPAPAATGPDYHLSFSYTHVSMPIPGAVTTNLRGVDVSAGMDFKPHFGVALDGSGAYTPDVLGTKHIGYLLSALGGPVFYPIEHGTTRPFVHFLAGVGLVDGATPISKTSYFYGYQSRFSYAAGGGLEHAVVGRFAIRFGGDYLRTAFYDAAGVVKPQNNLRMTVGFLVHLNPHPARTILR